MTMRRFIVFFCVMAALLVPVTTSCSSSRHNAGRDLHPDDVFTLTEEDIVNETLRINRTLQGDWKYNAPSVGVSGKNLIAGIAKPIAKGKLKKKLKNAYKKIGLYKVKPQFTFNEDGSCSISMLGASMKGTYNYNPTTEKITFKWHGVPLSASLKRDGKKKLQLTFDADKLLSLFSLLSKLSNNSVLKALAFLTDHYDDVMVGFELKK